MLASAHTTTCPSLYRSELLCSSVSVVSSAWRFLCHLPLEQANTWSLRAALSPSLGYLPIMACVPPDTQTVFHGHLICLPAPDIQWGPCVPLLFTLNWNLEEKFKLLDFPLRVNTTLPGAAILALHSTHSWPPWNLAFHLLPCLRTHSRCAFIGEPSHSAAVTGTDSGSRESWIQVFFLLFTAHVSGCFPAPLSLGFLLCKMRIKIVHLPYQFILRHSIKCGSYLVLVLNRCQFLLSRPIEQCRHTVTIQKMFSLQMYKEDSTVSPTSQMRELGNLHVRIWTGSQTCTSLLGSHDTTYLSIP